MRWRFIDPHNRQENAERAATVAKIESWWREFQSKTADLEAIFSQQAEWDLPVWMEEHLQGIHSHLMWEFGPAVRCDGHRLVITPETRHELKPLVDAILQRAPTLPGWEFYPNRLAEDVEAARSTVEGRTGVDISDYKVRVSRGDQQCIDLMFTSPAISDPEDQAASGAGFVAAESLLGEEILDHWIGLIEVTPPPRERSLKSVLGLGRKETAHFVPLDRLHDTVHALVDSIRDQLPRQPQYEWIDKAKWTLWELQPEEAEDYYEQQDLFVGKSANPTMWHAAHHDGIFCSRRFSRCEETFCYLKLDGSEGLDQSQFADKSEIEDAVDEVLKPAKLGCQIGGGTGLRYSYIDLALTDLERGIEAIRRRLQAGNIPKRSWIQFFDSDLAAEWVGIYDDTPAPPLEDEDS